MWFRNKYLFTCWWYRRDTRLHSYFGTFYFRRRSRTFKARAGACEHRLIIRWHTKSSGGRICACHKNKTSSTSCQTTIWSPTEIIKKKKKNTLWARGVQFFLSRSSPQRYKVICLWWKRHSTGNPPRTTACNMCLESSLNFALLHVLFPGILLFDYGWI